ncbi:helix-hairpin-helix domain-containing protein [Armatimonas sp.]|uniref:helix-hairpin-helix domain-containing protein n=1 Tax=Armatimonas sp. TaxID=1872638 RepID=UPI00286BD327|nr:helix-hairpin-helix domain-containing protein [Armatimonas sp.]
MQNPLTSLTHRERLGLVVAISALALFGIGSSLRRTSAAPLQPTTIPAGARPSPAPSASPAPKATSTTPSPKPTAPLVVYVSGAVKRPGVYSFPPGARLHQAIQKAGGFKSGAQEDALNLAGYLEDADQIYVPLTVQKASPVSAISVVAPTVPAGQSRGKGRLLGKPIASPPVSASPASSATKFHTPGEGQVKLNSATLEDLQKLPGVGPSTAQSILAYRQQSGSFKEIDELKEVRGIGEKKFAKMQPFLAL